MFEHFFIFHFLTFLTLFTIFHILGQTSPMCEKRNRHHTRPQATTCMTTQAMHARAGALMSPSSCLDGGITRVGPGQNPQHTGAHSGWEAVGCSQNHDFTHGSGASSCQIHAQSPQPQWMVIHKSSSLTEQWTVQSYNEPSLLPAVQTILKIVEIRKNRVQQPARVPT